MEMATVTHEEFALALLRTAGKVLALDFAVQAALALHPDKKRILKLWDEYLPERIDEWMQAPEYQIAAFRDELHSKLGEIRTFVEAAAAAEAQDDDNED